jgi:1-deoxy-D-xylulose-5-phosphate synthase
MNEEELRNLMYTAQQENMGAFVIRYPRGNGVMTDWKKPMKAIAVGKGRKLKEGKDIAILSIGHIGNLAVDACNNLAKQGIEAAHYDMRFVKPLDEALLHEVFQNYKLVVTVEDATVVGGLGSAELEFMNEHNYHSQVRILGIPDTIVEHGSVKELQQECHYDAIAIANAVKNLLGKSVLVEG